MIDCERGQRKGGRENSRLLSQVDGKKRQKQGLGVGCQVGFECFGGAEGVSELAAGCGQALTVDSCFSVGPCEKSSLLSGQY